MHVTIIRARVIPGPMRRNFESLAPSPPRRGTGNSHRFDGLEALVEAVAHHGSGEHFPITRSWSDERRKAVVGPVVKAEPGIFEGAVEGEVGDVGAAVGGRVRDDYGEALEVDTSAR